MRKFYVKINRKVRPVKIVKLFRLKPFIHLIGKELLGQVLFDKSPLLQKGGKNKVYVRFIGVQILKILNAGMIYS
jgi:hypothetical protein